MKQPVQNLSDLRKFGPLRQNWAIDHQHRQAQRPRRIQLGARPRAACVLGHDQLRPMVLHQRPVVSFGKRPSGGDHLCVRQGQSVGLIHKAQQVTVLRLGRKIFKMHSANCKEDTLSIAGQCVDGGSDIGHVMPDIAGLRHPGRAGQRCQWRPRRGARLNRVPAHPGRKWMGRVHDMGDGIVTDIGGQTFRTAETANPYRQGLRTRVFDPSSVGIHSRNPLFRNSFGQRIGLGRSAKDQEVCHV